jgi:5-methylcytosine-specific restriction protein A
MPDAIPNYRPRWLPSKEERRALYDRSRSNDEWRRFINSTPWRRCSKSFLAGNPLCVHCLKDNRLAAATQTHHTKGQDMEFAFDESTFEAVCVPCHSRITLAEIKSK